jgi:hypothetical protein
MRCLQLQASFWFCSARCTNLQFHDAHPLENIATKTKLKDMQQLLFLSGQHAFVFDKHKARFLFVGDGKEIIRVRRIGENKSKLFIFSLDMCDF